jgi:BMFP domain-containing protein YqiC
MIWVSDRLALLAGRDDNTHPCGPARGSPFFSADFQASREPTMTQTSSRIFDEMARLMNDAAGVASGVKREFDTLFKSQAERFLRDLDVVKREEFEAVKEMAKIAREENEALKRRVAMLEAKIERGDGLLKADFETS